MRSPLFRAGVLGLALLAAPATARAQWVVYDPSNFAQAVLRFRQLIQEYRFMVRQARRLPVDMATRYRIPPVRWRVHDELTAYPYARAILTSLNAGDRVGAGYRAATDPLDVVDDVLAQLPPALRRRLATDYGTIEFADSVATMGIHQTGTIRVNGRAVIRAIEAMESDAVADAEGFHTQTALLNKINGAAVLGLRLGERTNQFLLHTLEQLLVDTTRTRNTEAKLMNAHIHQWRYGTQVGDDLFRTTAQRLDAWRQP